MKKILIVPAVIGLLAVPSFAMAQQGADDSTTARVGAKNNSALDIRHTDKRVDATAHVTAQDRVNVDDDAAIPAIPATPAVPAVDHNIDDVTGHVEAETENSTDDSGHHTNVTVSADKSSVDVASNIDE